MVTLTERAKEYLKSVSNGNFVTLSVKGGGCSGFQYEWGLTDKPLSDPIDDVLVVDPPWNQGKTGYRGVRPNQTKKKVQ